MDTRLGNWDGGGSEALKVGRSISSTVIRNGGKTRLVECTKYVTGGALLMGNCCVKLRLFDIHPHRQDVRACQVRSSGRESRQTTVVKGTESLSDSGIPEEEPRK